MLTTMLYTPQPLNGERDSFNYQTAKHTWPGGGDKDPFWEVSHCRGEDPWQAVQSGSGWKR